MPLDQFLIAPMTEGVQTDVEPWLLPEEAFAELRNAYVWRGRLRKRFGSTFITPSAAPTAGYEQLTSRLRINLGNTDGAGDISGTVPGAIFKIGQMFSIGTDLFAVVALGTPGVMITNGAATTLTYHTGTGAYDIQGSALTTACFFYPAEPVMGLINYEVAVINDEPTYAFDTQFSYSFTAAGWGRLGTGLWTGSNSQFFWGENYRGTAADDTLLFITNNSSTDNIRYWNGAAWTTFTPKYTTTATDTIEGCRVILSFKNRLIFFNTYESIGGAGAVNYPNRIRYSQDGDPIDTVNDDSWVEGNYISGKGGFEDAATKEVIISARLLRDRVIVFFERSTWELVYTGNELRPFVFQRINAELGAESTFSTVLFDKVLLGVGNVGIHACNGANVERIDNKIPQAVFNFHNGNDGIERVYGIRDYFAELVYWAIPASVDDPTYPTTVLVYNYRNKTWSLNDDSITCFGYLQNLNDETWQIAEGEWQERTDVWNDGRQQSEYRQVIAGNQEGYTFIIDSDSTRNAPALQITQMSNVAGVVTVTAVDHNLRASEYVLIESENGNFVTDTTDGAGAASGNTPGIEWFPGQHFSIDTTIFTIVDGVGATAMDQSGPPVATATFDLATGEYVFIGAAALTNVIWLQTGVRGIYQIISAPTTLTFTINEPYFAGVYTGGGTIARVSEIDIRTKEYNFYQKDGADLFVPRVSFYVTRTANGQISVDFSSSSSNISLVTEGTASGSILGTSILETTPYDTVTIEASQDRFWHVIYTQAEGETIQMRLYLSAAQMLDSDIALSDFQLNAISIYARRIPRY